MPGTARSVGLTPTTVHQIGPAYDAAAKLIAGYVKKYGSYRDALVAYNAGPGRVGGALPAETQNYLSTILINGRDPGKLGQPSSGGASTPTVPHGLSAADPVQSLTAGMPPGNSAAAAALIQQLSAGRRQPVASSALQPPAVTAGPVLPDAYRALTSTQGPAPRQDIGALLSMVQTQGGGTGVVTPQTDTSGPVTAPPAPAGGNTLVDAITAEAERINDAKVPYLWGGGHAAKQPRGSKVTPLDCSGAVSRVLGINPRVSGQFETFGETGRGDHVTIYANSKHVLMEVDGHFWGTSPTNPGGGAGWIPRSAISPGYLKNFTARHPRGM